jgi:predicted phosphodiesterase
MRYALISDIHANLQAWRAVSEDIDRVGVDQVICLGDIVGYGPNPAEVLEEVYLRADHFVLGNHDAVVAGRMDPECFNDTARKIIEWTRQQLNDTAKQFLAEVPMMLEGSNFVVSHAEFEIPDRFEYIFEPHEALPSFAATRRPYLFCGHTHFPCIISLDPQGETRFYRPRPMQFIQPVRYLVNVGSVGDPRDGDVRSSYVIFDAEKEEVEFRQVPFDTQAYRVAIKRAGIPTQPFLFDVLAEQKQLQAQPLRDFHAVAGAFKPGKAEIPVDISNLEAEPKTKIYIRRAGSGEKSVSAFAISGPKKVDPLRRAAIIAAVVGPLLLLILWLGYTISSAHQREERLAAGRLAREFIPAQAWTFNEGGGLHTRNLSGVSGDAQVDDGVMWGEGVSGTALVFPGDQRAVRVRGAKTFRPLELRQGFSLSFWMKAEAEGSGDLFVARRGDKPAWTVGMRSGAPHLYVFNNGKPALHVAGKGSIGGEASPERELAARAKFSPLNLTAGDWTVHTRFRAQQDGTLWSFGAPETPPEFLLYVQEGKLVLSIGVVAGLESETPVLDNAWHSVVVTANRQESESPCTSMG